MSTEPQPQDPKRLVVFLVLASIILFGSNIVLERLGLMPKPAEPRKEAVEDALTDEEGPGAADGETDSTATAEAEPTKPDGDTEVPAPEPEPEPAPRAALVDAARLVLPGPDTEGYNLRVEPVQWGAGIDRIESLVYDAEYEAKKPKDRPLILVDAPPGGPPALAMVALAEREEGGLEAVGDLEERAWQVLIDEAPLDELDEDAQAKADPVRILRDEQTGDEIGREIRFRTTLDSPAGEPPVVITKTLRLRKGRDAVDLLLDFHVPTGAAREREIIYRLHGPSGIPIEGEWYTYTFRNAFFGKGEDGSVTVETHSAYDVAYEDPGYYLSTQRPLAFGGVEDQYFTAFLRPLFPQEDRKVEAVMSLVRDAGSEQRKADVAVDLRPPSIEVAPGATEQQEFALYAGPKTQEALAAYDAGELATYRRAGKVRIPVLGIFLELFTWAYEGVFNPIVVLLSTWIVGPLLAIIYRGTEAVAGIFGGDRGSYGVAIILLTICVRLFMFPISRKQAASAKRMQELQPQLAALREKYKDDKEKLAQEHFALMRRYGVNPLAGCLPVLIQVPIFMTLWRTLNISISLRQAPFLWIDNLAAPDMLFKMPFELPLLGPYFNLLPLGVIGLMLAQTKLFTPPAATPEQEQQQKVMKFMMVGMMLMFYRVPAGLALYFITSSSWAIGERLLLPKTTATLQPRGGEDDEDDRGNGGNGSKPGGNGGPGGTWLSRKLDELLKEAEKERTIRREGGDQRDRDREVAAPGLEPSRRDRRNPKKGRSKPGKRR